MVDSHLLQPLTACLQEHISEVSPMPACDYKVCDVSRPFLALCAPSTPSRLQAEQLRRSEQLQVFRCAFVIDVHDDLIPTWTFCLVYHHVPHGQRDFQRQR